VLRALEGGDALQQDLLALHRHNSIEPSQPQLADVAKMERLEDAPERGVGRSEIVRVGDHVPGDGAPQLGQPRQQLHVLQERGVVGDFGLACGQPGGILLGRGQLVLELGALLGPIVRLDDAVLEGAADTLQPLLGLSQLALGLAAQRPYLGAFAGGAQRSLGTPATCRDSGRPPRPATATGRNCCAR